MQQWWWRIRPTLRGVLFPLICIQFLRTLLMPTGFDVLILFGLFLLYLGLLFNMI